MSGIPFPNINPVFATFGPLEIKWYSLAYIVGAVAGLIYTKGLVRRTNQLSFLHEKSHKRFFDDLLSYSIIGVLLGGRLGYIIFYNLSYYSNNLVEIFFIWQGGMSFHGGLLGVVFANYLLSQKYSISILKITDMIAPALPIGLFLGRIANFINAELYGKVTTVPWGVIFPNQYVARHPSQLYEAALEGIVLFIILFVLWKKEYYKQTGTLTGVGLASYGIFRSFVEFFRVPDYTILHFISIGQLLSIPMIIIGIYILKKSYVKSEN